MMTRYFSQVKQKCEILLRFPIFMLGILIRGSHSLFVRWEDRQFLLDRNGQTCGEHKHPAVPDQWPSRLQSLCNNPMES